VIARIRTRLSSPVHRVTQPPTYTVAMKKPFMTAIIMTLALATSTAAWAQTGGGIKAGVNFAQTSGSDDEPGRRIGAIAGLFATFAVAPAVAIQPEVLFSMQGTKLSTETASIDYIQIPLLLRIGSNSRAGASVYGVVGPSVGIYVRDDGWVDDINRTDVGLAVGVGVTVSRLLVEARYTAGLTEFSKGTVAYKHRVFSLMAGLHF
jgi:hypothetical protein